MACLSSASQAQHNHKLPRLRPLVVLSNLCHSVQSQPATQPARGWAWCSKCWKGACPLPLPQSSHWYTVLVPTHISTPPDHRRHGYGSLVTGCTTQHLLTDRKLPAVCLFTDLANPVSNHIYQVRVYTTQPQPLPYSLIITSSKWGLLVDFWDVTTSGTGLQVAVARGAPQHHKQGKGGMKRHTSTCILLRALEKIETIETFTRHWSWVTKPNTGSSNTPPLCHASRSTPVQKGPVFFCVSSYESMHW